MTGIDQNNAERQRKNFNDLREEMSRPVDSMKLSRYRQLRAMEKSGSLPDLSEEDLQQYQDFEQSLEKSQRTMDRVFNPPILKAFKRQDDITEALRKRADVPPFPRSTMNLKPITNHGATAAARLEEIAAQGVEAKAEQRRNADYLSAIHEVLDETRAMRQRADSQQAKQNGFNNRMAWVALLLAAAGVVMPILENTVWQ